MVADYFSSNVTKRCALSDGRLPLKKFACYRRMDRDFLSAEWHDCNSKPREPRINGSMHQAHNSVHEKEMNEEAHSSIFDDF